MKMCGKELIHWKRLQRSKRLKAKGEGAAGMVGWHSRLNEHEYEQILGDSEGQGAWCAALHGGYKELDMT